MGRSREIQALPSLLEKADKTLVAWEEIEQEERENAEQTMSEHIGRNLGAYFASREQEWKGFSSLLEIGRT